MLELFLRDFGLQKKYPKGIFGHFAVKSYWNQ